MKEIEIQDEVSDETCEKCGQPMVYKMGRFGKFLACSGFPDCRNTKPIVKDIGVDLPEMQGRQNHRAAQQKGPLFYGCDQYPDCDYVSWDKPVGKPCPNCGGLMVEKRNRSGAKLHLHRNANTAKRVDEEPESAEL